MKNLRLIIYIVVILALVCSPVIAVSSSDLIAQYRGQSVPTTTPTPVTPSSYIMPSSDGDTPLNCDPTIFEGLRHYDPNSTYGLNIHNIAVPMPDNPRVPIPTTPTPSPTPTVIPTTMPTQAPSNCSYPPCMHYESGMTRDGPAPDRTPTVIPTPVPTQAPPPPLSPYAIYIKIKSSLLESLLSPPYPDGPIKKPNIYLYSDRDLTAQVQLTPEKAITVSEPEYQPGKGWLAQIRDGSLNGNGDFLFYEALVPDSGWQKEEGYVIRAAYREQDMAAMLGPYGFNEKETVEFIEYWASHLIGNVDYVFYPLETDAVERVMPLSVSPKPDHVMRIWFYAEPLVSAPEPVTHPEKIVREGFYVVEWGVFINDEYEINHSAVSEY